MAQLVPSLFLVIASHLVSPPVAAQTIAPASVVPRTAPAFSRLDLHHQKISLSTYRGKVVLLNFWATWCAPCLMEMPTFADWQKQYGTKEFQVIGVSMDDAPTEVIATIAKLKLDYPVLMGDEHLGVAYGGVLGLPVTFLIDRKERSKNGIRERPTSRASKAISKAF